MPPQTSRSLVGRAVELQRLTAALARAARGAGQTVLLAGAMGMGRSRLLQELAAEAQTRGHLVLAGRAYPLHAHLPYAPIIHSLGTHLGQLKAPQQAELLAGLPHLSWLLGEQPRPADGPLQPLQQVHLLEEMARFVQRLTREQTLVWSFDDLHLADAATVEVFCYLARNIQTHRVLLLASYRNDEAHALLHLRMPLLSLARHGLSEEVQLDRLTPADVASLTSQRVGGRPARSLLEYLEARAMGTPLIALSLLDSLEAQNLFTRIGGAVGLGPAAAQHPSPAPREIILERLVPVGKQERKVLDFLAVLGGTAESGELAGAMQCAPEELLAALAALQEAGLLKAQEHAGQASVKISLSHPFLQDVLYAELPSFVRRHYHAQVAAALERATPVPLERLARHYEGSGGVPDPQRALQVILSAAQGALLTAGPDAVHFCQVALALVRSGMLPDRLPEVLLRLGQALTLSGELTAAREALREALAVCEERGDANGIGAMHQHLAYIAVVQGDLDAAEAHVQSGLAHIAPDSAAAELPHLYGLRFSVHLLRGEHAALPQLAADLACAAALSDTPVARAWHTHARMWVELIAGQVEIARSTAQACLQEAWLSGDPNLIVMAALDHAYHHLLRGDHQAAAAELRATLNRLPRGYRFVAEHSLSPLLSMAELLGGHWEAALQVSDESAPLEPFMQAIPRANLGTRAAILIRQGDLAQARACLDEGRNAPRPFVTDYDYAVALLALEAGDYQAASELAARLYSWGLSPLGVALLAEARAALGDPETVGTLAAALTMASPHLPLVGALATWTAGLAERTAGNTAAAIGAFSTAADQFERLAMPFEAARARFEQAMLMAATNRRGASDLARRSLQTFARLGAQLWVDRVHRWQSGQPLRTDPVRPKSGALFSDRELQIIRLLADGLTSAEIAARLVLSPRTVANHLDRMYTRHDVRNRLSLVRFAHESGSLR